MVSCETEKNVLVYDTMQHTPEIQSNICWAVKTVPSSKMAGNTFMLGSENKMVCCVNFDPSQKYESQWLETQGKYVGHSAAVRHVETSPDGTRMLSSCEDHSMRLWDTESYQGVALMGTHSDVVVSMTIPSLLTYVCRQAAHS